MQSFQAHDRSIPGSTREVRSGFRKAYGWIFQGTACRHTLPAGPYATKNPFAHGPVSAEFAHRQREESVSAQDCRYSGVSPQKYGSGSLSNRMKYVPRSFRRLFRFGLPLLGGAEIKEEHYLVLRRHDPPYGPVHTTGIPAPDLVDLRGERNGFHASRRALF